MFWGLILEPGKRYSTSVSKSFHVSMAALDCASVKSDSEIVSVILECDGQEIILCNLTKKVLQSHVDLNFMTGDKVSFEIKGGGIVHLSGYLVPEDDDYDMGMLDNEEVDDDEEEEDEEVEELSKQNDKEKQKNKRKREPPQVNSKKKKVKLGEDSDEESDEDDEDEDEDEDVLSGLSKQSDVAAASSDEDEEDDDDSDEEEDDDSDEDESIADESDEDEDEEIQVQSKKQKTPQSNKKAQQSPNKQTPNNKQQPGNKQGTTPLLNGTAQLSGKKNKKKGNQETPNQKTPNQNDLKAKNQKTPNESGTPASQQKKKNLEGGVQVKDIREGTGPVAKSGQMVAVYYQGRLKSNNKMFDECKKGGAPFKFRLGKGEVIKGWDIGVSGMKVGGVRMITCPPNAAYGQKGSPPQIPPNSALVFQVELKSVN